MKNRTDSPITHIFLPISLIFIGLAIFQSDPSAFNASMNQLETIAFGIFTVGCFSFIVIFNYIKNPLATEKSLIYLSQSLIISGGILTAAVYSGIIPLINLISTVCFILVIGTTVAVLTDYMNIDILDIK